MPENLDFNGFKLMQSGLHPASGNLGMIEIDLSRILRFFPNATEALMIGLASFQMPSPRSANKETVHYLNASVNFAGKINPIGELNIEFQDYLNGPQRAICDAWWALVFDSRTGLGRLKKDYSCNAITKLLGPDGNVYTSYELYNVFPLKEPAAPAIQYDGGNLIKIQMDFAVDLMIPVVQNGIPVSASGIGTLGARSAFASAALAINANAPISVI